MMDPVRMRFLAPMESELSFSPSDIGFDEDDYEAEFDDSISSFCDIEFSDEDAYNRRPSVSWNGKRYYVSEIGYETDDLKEGSLLLQEISETFPLRSMKSAYDVLEFFDTLPEASKAKLFVFVDGVMTDVSGEDFSVSL